ncbi:leucine--tRNA ligase [Tuwongella immobilis]|nr:leucine--tRNA ligase [Tuwongella immobilis]
MPKYQPRDIEPRWQQYWQQHQTFRTQPAGDPEVENRPKYYILDMFPYPSGEGLHVGHPEGYTATDILSRFKRMNGFHVLHPMGWDAFGLPAEQYAIRTGTHPRITTQRNIDNFRRQIQSLGFSYDWDREVDTTDPNYVKWTQWIFLTIYDTWYDFELKKGRPISELPIPSEIAAAGTDAIRRYQDQHRLAYQAEIPVNWCPGLGTVLANEEVIDGKSEVGGFPVIRMPLRQWQLRITAYAERLLEDLEPLSWPDSIKKMQRDWIGKSEGAEVDFPLVDHNQSIRVFTTRPDTLFGATYMVLAPEHPLVPTITSLAQREAVEAYQLQASRKSDLERTELAKVKSGVWTGAYARNPVNDEQIPIWIADYVLATYGTGAIMAVPAHDERDFAFAKTFQLNIRTVVQPNDAWLQKSNSTIDALTEAYTDEGVVIQSGPFNGLTSTETKRQIIEWLEEKKIGQRKINFKLRDWLFSRQRYWGEPFPLLHEVDDQGNLNGLIRPLTVEELPLRLPDLEDFRPTGTPEPPLSKATDWVNVTIDGKRYRRETNTMPQWAGSCWYFLRYIDPQNQSVFADPKQLAYWLPIDLYVGGAEHAVLHLLYSRFWHKILFDRGYVPCPEPFQRLVNQGMILGDTEFTGFQHATVEESPNPDDPTGKPIRKLIPTNQWVSSKQVTFDGSTARLDSKEKPELACVKLSEDQVEKSGEHFVLKEIPEIRIDYRSYKMSKSRGNVVNPDRVVTEYGADSLRLYEMFMGPLEATKPWNMRNVEGVSRFLAKVWRLIVDESAEEPRLSPAVQAIEPSRETEMLFHRTIQKVTEDTEGLRFNTAIAAMMEFSNHLTSLTNGRPKAVLETFVLLLAPYAPHLAEELWAQLGHQQSLAYETWPKYDPALTQSETIEIPIQINGKLRSRLDVPQGTNDADLEKLALGDPKIREAIGSQNIKRVIVKSMKLVNIVVG